MEHAGKHVAQEAPEARPVLAIDHILRKKSHGEIDGQNTDPYGQNRLDHVAQNDHQGQGSAKGTVEVGQPRVAAAVGADVVAEDILGDDHRPVEAPQEIGGSGSSGKTCQTLRNAHRHDERVDRTEKLCQFVIHIYPSLSPF